MCKVIVSLGFCSIFCHKDSKAQSQIEKLIAQICVSLCFCVLVAILKSSKAIRFFHNMTESRKRCYLFSNNCFLSF